MKTVGFIGAYDKIDLILYIAKILATARKKVLVIDATLIEKTRYIVPTITPTKSYITEFEGFDVAVGFKNMNEIREYLGAGEKTLIYDIVLCDIDNKEAIQNFEIRDNYKNLFITAFDLYSLKKGLELLSNMHESIKLTKVLISKNMAKEENEFLNYLSSRYSIEWDDIIFNFPLEIGNYAITIENQIVSRIRIKGLSNYYKNGLAYLIEIIFHDDISQRELALVMKSLEREV